MCKGNFNKQIVNEAPFGFAYYEIVADDKCQAFYYRFPEINEAFKNPTNFISNTQIIPGIEKVMFGLTSNLRTITTWQITGG
jgi:hypothetical protein